MTMPTEGLLERGFWGPLGGIGVKGTALGFIGREGAARDPGEDPDEDLFTVCGGLNTVLGVACRRFGKEADWFMGKVGE